MYFKIRVYFIGPWSKFCTIFGHLKVLTKIFLFWNIHLSLFTTYLAHSLSRSASWPLNSHILFQHWLSPAFDFSEFFLFLSFSHKHQTPPPISHSPLQYKYTLTLTASLLFRRFLSLLVLLEERSCLILMSCDRPSPLCYRSVCAHVSPLHSHLALQTAVSWTWHRLCWASLISTRFLCSMQQIPGQWNPAVQPDSFIDYSVCSVALF